jgi:DNA polymerase elongation subunit (family B)
MTITWDIETSGNNTLSNRITCISCNRDGVITSFCGEDEVKIMTDFWNYVQDGEELNGFNTDEYDVPYLLKRCFIKGIRIKKFKSVDIRKVINSFFYSYKKYEEGKKSDFAILLNMRQKTDDGFMMIIHYENKDWAKIQEHCEEDVDVEYKLYLRLKELNFL